MRRQAQLFIHRYYENIKLVLLLVILGLCGYAVLAILANNADSSRQRGEGIIRIVKSIELETDEQTKVINRQFQALCFLLVETSGKEALKNLDPPLEEQCRDLARELRNEEQREAAETRQAQPLRVAPAPAAPLPQTSSPSPATPSVQDAVGPQRTALPQETKRQGPRQDEPAPSEPKAGPIERVLVPILQPIRGLL